VIFEISCERRGVEVHVRDALAGAHGARVGDDDGGYLLVSDVRLWNLDGDVEHFRRHVVLRERARLKLFKVLARNQDSSNFRVVKTIHNRVSLVRVFVF